MARKPESARVFSMVTAGIHVGVRVYSLEHVCASTRNQFFSEISLYISGPFIRLRATLGRHFQIWACEERVGRKSELRLARGGVSPPHALKVRGHVCMEHLQNTLTHRPRHNIYAHDESKTHTITHATPITRPLSLLCARTLYVSLSLAHYFCNTNPPTRSNPPYTTTFSVPVSAMFRGVTAPCQKRSGIRFKVILL